MKKLFTLCAALFVAASTLAQSSAPMSFAGPSRFGVAAMDAWQDNESDTLVFLMIDATQGDITLPAMTYTAMGMTIPSFTIHNAQFDFDYNTLSASFPEQTYSETIQVGDTEKAITGASLTAEYNHAEKTFTLETSFTYGSMPLQVTYKIEGAYVASTSSLNILRETALRESKIYDITGRRVSTMVAGRMYIINGKKVIWR